MKHKLYSYIEGILCTDMGRVFSTYTMFIFILSALTIQALIPAGYMPSFNSDGMVEIQICTINGMQTVRMDADKAPLPAEPAHDNQETHNICPYITTASAPVAVSSPDVSVIDYIYIDHIYTQINFLHTQLTEPPYQSRAPPIFIL